MIIFIINLLIIFTIYLLFVLFAKCHHNYPESKKTRSQSLSCSTKSQTFKLIIKKLGFLKGKQQIYNFILLLHCSSQGNLPYSALYSITVIGYCANSGSTNKYNQQTNSIID